MKKWFSIILFILFGCNTNSNITIKLIDEVSNRPIEGAWIHILEDYSVLRSDVNGEVELPLKVKSIEIIS